MLLLVLMIVGGIVAYFVYTPVKEHKERVKLEKEKAKLEKEEEQAIQRAKVKEMRQKCWASLPAFYATIPRQNLPNLLRALENREYLYKKYPLNKAITGANPQEIVRLRHELISEIEAYSGKSLLEFTYEDLHIQYLKQILGTRK